MSGEECKGQRVADIGGSKVVEGFEGEQQYFEFD